MLLTDGGEVAADAGGHRTGGVPLVPTGFSWPEKGPLMSLYLFAGTSVDDFAGAVAWYEKLLGAAPSSFPHETEAVWELAEGRLVYVVRRPEHAGHGTLTLIVDDLEDTVRGIAERGVEPVREEHYANGVRKCTYADPEGNEIGFGEVPR